MNSKMLKLQDTGIWRVWKKNNYDDLEEGDTLEDTIMGKILQEKKYVKYY